VHGGSGLLRAVPGINPANLLTALRIILIPAFATLWVYGRHQAALGVFVLAAVTDALDGLVARHSRQPAGLGSFLDPLADKCLLLTAFALLAAAGLVPRWALVLVASREVVILGGWMIRHLITRSRTVMPSALGKATTVFQVLAVTALLVDRSHPLPQDAARRLLDVAMVLTAISGLDYLWRGLRELEPRSPN
jgi:CDP-diacylglycerol--glycerol-3-phosphate 3-phosphatidyltransferase